VSTERGNVVAPGQQQGTGVRCLLSHLSNPQHPSSQPLTRKQQMNWSSAPLPLLNTYRIAHHLPTPAAFTSPYHQALLQKPGVGRQSPTMARKREKRRVSKEQLALAVRKNFNSAAVNEIDVVVDLVYKVRTGGEYDFQDKVGFGDSCSLTQSADKAFRMRSAPGVVKKS
jgi:histone deacetylase complex subunit SAP30